MKIDLEHWNSNILFTDRAEFSVDDYVAKAPHIEDYNLKLKLEEWRDIGVVVFEKCVTDELIDKLLGDIEYLCKNRADFEFEMEYKGARHQIKDLPVSPLSDTGIKFNCLENISLAARHLSLTRLVCSFLGHAFQDQPTVIQSLTFWRGSQQPAHLDYPWVRVQTRLPHLAASWLPLEDIHQDAGPLAYYPGTHKHGFIPPFDWGHGSVVQEPDSVMTPDDFVTYLAEQVEKRNIKKKIFLPKRGDALIWHGNVLHEGTKVNDPRRTRRSYVTHYTSLKAYPPNHRFPDALQNHKYTSMNGGYVFDHPWIKDSRQLPSWKSI